MGRVVRFAADLLAPGICVVEHAPTPEHELTARAGVIIAETTTTTGERAWIILDHTGRTFTLSDNEIHSCPTACALCPRWDRKQLRNALARLLTDASRTPRRWGTDKWTTADTERHNRIRTLLRALAAT